MASPITTEDLVASTRSLIDERNLESVDDTLDIIPSLNRAQVFAADILARKYEEPLLTYYPLSFTAGQSEYAFPEDTFEDRVIKVEINIGGLYVPLTRISYRDISIYETPNQNQVPLYYCLVGRKIRFVGTPSATYPARIWYIRQPENLVATQGRITRVQGASNYVLVDSVGSDLTTETDNLNSYVNVIDAQSGIVKGSFQIKNINGTKVEFKTIPTRTTVQNKTIDTDLADLNSELTVEEDDYLCNIRGTNVPVPLQQMQNFMVQYAVAEMSRKVGSATGQEEQLVTKFEEQLEKQWVGQEQSLRVKKRNRIWTLPYRRWFTSEN